MHLLCSATAVGPVHVSVSQGPGPSAGSPREAARSHSPLVSVCSKGLHVTPARVRIGRENWFCAHLLSLAGSPGV